MTYALPMATASSGNVPFARKVAIAADRVQPVPWVWVVGILFPGKWRKLDPSKKIVVHCAAGSRSQMAAEYLVKQGFTDVCNLHGGIFAWIDEIDPTMSRY